MVGSAVKSKNEHLGSTFETRIEAVREKARRYADPGFEGFITRVKPTKFGRFKVVSLPVEMQLIGLDDDLFVGGSPTFLGMAIREKRRAGGE
jgi:hypothetical protein